MAICTQCGTLLNNIDAPDHQCDPMDIPEAGMIVKKGSSEAIAISSMSIQKM